jgi:uncharacterized membrane protein YoaK (UPF0700 family)
MDSYFHTNWIQLAVVFAALFVVLKQYYDKNSGKLEPLKLSSAQRLFWSLLIAFIIAAPAISADNPTFYALSAVAFVYLYFFKQYYRYKR